MNNKVLLPVYRKNPSAARQPAKQAEQDPADKPVSFFRKMLNNFEEFARDVHQTTSPQIEGEYYYDLAKALGFESKPLAGYEKPTPEIVKNLGSFRIEMSQSDLEQLNEIKSTAYNRLSPILEKHGLRFRYDMNSGPNEMDDGVFAGYLRWYLIEKKYERVLTHDRNRTLFQIESGAHRMIFHDKNQVTEGNYLTFKIRMRGTPHYESMRIPSHGIGAEFFLEELFAVLERHAFMHLSFPSWRERLEWFCEMIIKHQDVILKPLPESMIETVFDSIRARAIKV